MKNKMFQFLFAFLFFSTSCSSQDFPFEEVLKNNNIQEIEKIIASYNFLKVSELSDSILYEGHFNRYYKGDTITFIYAQQLVTPKKITKTINLTNSNHFSLYERMIKKTGFTRIGESGNKLGGYILEYSDKKDKTFTIYKIYDLDKSDFRYRIYFP